jgi:transposase
MPQNFIACVRGQGLLMPPDVSDGVPEDHLVWSVLRAVDEMDLDAFHAAYRADGHGRAGHEPSMDVVYKVITAMRAPDHSTIAEFRRRHERALAELFSSVLALCREAGLPPLADDQGSDLTGGPLPLRAPCGSEPHSATGPTQAARMPTV